jgi:hypothetical protein
MKCLLTWKKLARESKTDSAISNIFDIFCLIWITGFRVAEYAQTTQTKVDMHEYPSGNWVVKAFLPTDWVFKNDKGRLIKIHSLEIDINTPAPKEVKITFRIQKNCQNGQKITITADHDHPTIFPVRAAY